MILQRNNQIYPFQIRTRKNKYVVVRMTYAAQKEGNKIFFGKENAFIHSTTLPFNFILTITKCRYINISNYTLHEGKITL